MSVRFLGVVAAALLAVSTQAATAQDAGANDSAAVPNGLVLQNSVPDSQWTVSSDAITLTRHKPDYRPLVGDFPSGPVLASAVRSAFQHRTGLRDRLDAAPRGGHRLGHRRRLFQHGQFQHQCRPSGRIRRDLTGNPFCDADLRPRDNVGFHERSDPVAQRGTQPRRDVGEFFSVLAGFRYIEFDDNLAISTAGGGFSFPSGGAGHRQ